MGRKVEAYYAEHFPLALCKNKKQERNDYYKNIMK